MCRWKISRIVVSLAETHSTHSYTRLFAAWDLANANVTLVRRIGGDPARLVGLPNLSLLRDDLLRHLREHVHLPVPAVP